MSLLTLEHVSKSYRRGRRVQLALDDVSLTVEPGELVSIWGVPRSGKTTLLRVAAGLERPDAGVVRLGERLVDPKSRSSPDADVALARTDISGAGGQSVVDYVAMPLLARGIAPSEACARAEEELERVGVTEFIAAPLTDLDGAEVVRVSIAQALVTAPRLLMVDDPTREIDPLERAPLLLLLRSLVDQGTALLMTTGEAMGVAGADRAFAMGNGKLRTESVATLAPVISLHRSATGSGLA